MLLDVRTYKCHPGTLGAQLDLYAKKGAGPQIQCLGQPVLYLKSETGNPNEYVHIWAYENAADREAKRVVLYSNEEWLAYIRESTELGAIAEQSNKLMTPCDFVPEPKLP